jgi:regulation of enolase protein 1 (concanavalin A-like superfamily)
MARTLEDSWRSKKPNDHAFRNVNVYSPQVLKYLNLLDMTMDKFVRHLENRDRPTSIARWVALFFALTSGGGLFAQISRSPVSDNFDAPALNSAVWSFVNPLGDGVLTMNGTAATLNIPHGKSHDLWITGNNSVRIMQPMQNVDFGVEVRFQSAVQLGNQDEGILVEQDNANFIRFDVLSDGTNVRLFAAAVTGGTATTFTNSPISAPNAPIWLRLRRSGNSWTGSWSVDGANFIVGTRFSFTLNVSQIGPYAGTASTGDSPSFTAIVDYFFNRANRLPNQDGPTPFNTVTVEANPPSALVEKTLANIQGIPGHLNPVAGFEAPTGGIFWYQPPAASSSTGPWIKHTIVADGDAYEDMTPYDVNADGAIDIIASYQAPNANGHALVWFENPLGHGGNPATDTWNIHAIGTGQGENNIVLSDIDGDGKIDIATPTFIYFQNSPDSWTQVQYNTAFRGIALLDIGSGFGSINLVSTGPAPSYDVVWFENPREHGGNARTDSWIIHDIGPAFPCPLCAEQAVAAYAATELNGDGRMDIVASQADAEPSIPPPPGGLVWYEAPPDRRNGTWLRHTVDANFVDAHTVKIADVDQNGTHDIVTAEQDQSSLRRVSVFYNDGHGNFTEQVVSNEEGHNVAVGDVTGTE